MFSIVDIAVDVVAVVVVVVDVIGFAFLHLNLAIKETSYDPKYHQTLEQQTLMAIFERAPKWNNNKHWISKNEKQLLKQQSKNLQLTLQSKPFPCFFLSLVHLVVNWS